MLSSQVRSSCAGSVDYLCLFASGKGDWHEPKTAKIQTRETGRRCSPRQHARNRHKVGLAEQGRPFGLFQQVKFTCCLSVQQRCVAGPSH